MDQFDQHMFPFDERRRASDSEFADLSRTHRRRCSAVLPWSRASASAADTESSDLQRAAGQWGTRRPPGGRARRDLGRGRRASQRVASARLPRDPNRDCRVFIDYAGNGLYAMTMQVRGEAPVVIERTEHAADLIFGAGMQLEPGLKASVSEAAMMAAMLGFQVWSPKELLRSKPDLGRRVHVRVGPDGPDIERVAEVGFRHFVVSRRWAYAAFNSFLSRKQLRLMWKREERQAQSDRKDQADGGPKGNHDENHDDNRDGKHDGKHDDSSER